MLDVCIASYLYALEAFESNDRESALKTIEKETEADGLEISLRAKHIKRLTNQQCNTEAGVVFLDSLVCLERISDHARNIAEEVLAEQKIGKCKSACGLTAACTFLKDMNSKYVYPNVFMSIEDTNKVSQYDTDIKKYAEQKKADWILNGGIEKEWDSYLDKMEKYGLSDYLAIKQKYFDQYQKSLSEENKQQEKMHE